MAPAEFEDRLQQVWLTLCSSEAAYIERALRQHRTSQLAATSPDRDVADAWSPDLRLYLDTLIERMDSDAPVSLRELEDCAPEAARGLLQRFLRDFGSLLCAWPDLVEGARELRERGIRLGRRL